MDEIYFRDEKVETVPDVDWSVMGDLMPDGIYFGMDEKEYRAAGAASASLFKDITISPMTAWTKNISGAYEDESSEAQEEGTALHKRLLEGETAFRERCAVKPENDGSYIEGIPELKARCKELGLKMGGNTEELCTRIREADPDAKLWAWTMRDFLAENDGKILLKPDVWQRMELRARLVGLHPEVRNAFRGGFSEVSIFWTDETGMPCKMRADYLKVSALVDLKYFANKNDKPIEEAVNTAIVQHRVQARHYLDGTRAAKLLARAGKVFGDAPNSEWLEAFADVPEHRFFWVFVQKGSVPEVDSVEFRRYAKAEGVTSENAYWTHATDRVNAAKRMLRLCLETYGAEPWIAERKTRALTDEDQPLWSLN